MGTSQSNSVIESNAGDLELRATSQNPGYIRARIPLGKCFSVNDVDSHLFSVTSIGRGYFKEKLGVGTDDPQGMLDVRGDIVTGGENLDINKKNTGKRYARLNFYGDDTYTDYSLRIIRRDCGPNADSRIEHRGKGRLALSVIDNGSLSFVTQNKERMNIDSEGNIGVGSCDPNFNLNIEAEQAKLKIKTVNSATNSYAGIFIEAPGNSELSHGALTMHNSVKTDYQGNALGLYNYKAGGNIYFSSRDETNANRSTPIMFLDGKNANVGLGTTSPTSPLDIKRNAPSAWAAQVENQSTSNGHGLFIKIADNPSGVPFAIYRGATPLFIVTNSSDVSVGGTLTAQYCVSRSDERFKKNITPIKSSLQKIKMLDGVSYNWKKEYLKNESFSKKTDIGLIAQNVESVLPELVHADEEGFKSVDYQKLTTVLVEAIKEVDSKYAKKISFLEKENQKLKEKFQK